MNLLKKLFAIVIITFFTKLCFAGISPDLQQKFDHFKVNFQKSVQPYLFWGQLSADQVMHQLGHALPQELQSEEISSLQEHATQYSESKDVVSLFMLAAFMYAYIPKDQQGVVVKFMMMLQVAFHELMKQQDVQDTHLLQLSLPHFHQTFSEIQINTLIMEANGTIASASHENGVQVENTPWNPGLFSGSFTLLTLMTSVRHTKPPQ